MIMETLYRIEEMSTGGWSLIEEDAHHLTKQQCDDLLNHYLSAGHNPNYLRVLRES
jgi:hypothetical protein